MKLSEEGLRLICSFEGYHTKQEDGSCKAYRCPAGVWTCGWGCTEGVDAHTHWSEAEAKERYRKELEKFEAAVLRHVKVPLNQNEFDALVSFAYNLGEGTLMKSSVLTYLNREKRVEAARAFSRFTKARSPKTRMLVTLPGLVSRRSREAALFLKPTEQPVEPYMPQSVVAEKSPARKVAEAVAGSAVATGVTVSTVPVPSIPAPPKEAIEAVTGWQNAAETLQNFAHSPVLKLAICGILIFVVIHEVVPRIAARMQS